MADAPSHHTFRRATAAELRRRQDHPELLDLNAGTLGDAAESLADLERVNALLFGVSATLDPLKAWLRRAPKAATVLDLGTGAGQLSRALARWAAHEYVPVRILAADLNLRHLAIARAALTGSRENFPPRLPRGGVQLFAADGFRLPLDDGAVDYVISSLLLHHFEPPSVVALLHECRRVARRGVVMSDLIRHPLPYLLFRTLVRPLLTRSPITTYDSEASFRRGYTPAELRALAQEILPDPRVRLHPLALRLVLSSDWNESTPS